MHIAEFVRKRGEGYQASRVWAVVHLKGSGFYSTRWEPLENFKQMGGVTCFMS